MKSVGVVTCRKGQPTELTGRPYRGDVWVPPASRAGMDVLNGPQVGHSLQECPGQLCKRLGHTCCGAAGSVPRVSFWGPPWCTPAE